MPKGDFVSVQYIPASFKLYREIEKFGGGHYSGVLYTLQNIMHEELMIRKRMYEKTVRTWRHLVKFYVEMKMESDSLIGSVWTDDEIYFYIDRGTWTRFAHMQNGFRAKTRPHVIGSRAGRYPDPIWKGSPPRPGIEPRRFTDEIYNRRYDPYMRKLKNFAHNVFRAYFGPG